MKAFLAAWFYLPDCPCCGRPVWRRPTSNGWTPVHAWCALRGYHGRKGWRR